MRLMRIMAVAVSLIVTGSVMAKPTNIGLTLNSIKDIVPNERSADEVYINVTATYSDGRFESYTVPGGDKPSLGQYGARFPAGPPQQPMIYWLAKGLKQVKDQSLWKAPLAPGEAVQLVISLVEHDMPPWNLDDLIGSVKIRIGNDKGRVTADWVLLSSEAKENKGRFKLNKAVDIDLRNGEGYYKLSISMKK